MNSLFDYFLGPSAAQQVLDGTFFKDDRSELLRLIDSYAKIPTQVGQIVADYLTGHETRLIFKAQDFVKFFLKGALPVSVGVLSGGGVAIAVTKTVAGSSIFMTPLFLRVLALACVISASAGGIMAIIDAQKILRPDTGRLYRYLGCTWVDNPELQKLQKIDDF